MPLWDRTPKCDIRSFQNLKDSAPTWCEFQRVKITRERKVAGGLCFARSLVERINRRHFLDVNEEGDRTLRVARHLPALPTMELLSAYLQAALVPDPALPPFAAIAL